MENILGNFGFTEISHSGYDVKGRVLCNEVDSIGKVIQGLVGHDKEFGFYFKYCTEGLLDGFK